MRDTNVHATATEWGQEKNAPAEHLEDQLGGLHNVHVPLIGRDVRKAINDITLLLRPAVKRIETAADVAVAAVDAYGMALVALEVWMLRFTQEGVKEPVPGRDTSLAWKMVGLLVADAVFLSVAYAVLGLTTWGMYIAASGSVLGVGLLGHQAGLELSHGVYHMLVAGHARAKADPESTDTDAKTVPLRAGISLGLAGVWALAAEAIVVGNAVVRDGYLSMEHYGGFTLPLLAVQTGILVATIAVSYHAPSSHPHHKEATKRDKETGPLLVAKTAAVSLLDDSVGEARGLLDQIQTVLAIGGHEVNASRADVPRQRSFVRHVVELVSEPQSDPMHPQTVKGADGEPPSSEELLKTLTGITDLPKYDEINAAAKVHQQEAHWQKRLNLVREQRLQAIHPHATDAPETVAPSSANESGKDKEDTSEETVATTFDVAGNTVHAERPSEDETHTNGNGKVKEAQS